MAPASPRHSGFRHPRSRGYRAGTQARKRWMFLYTSLIAVVVVSALAALALTVVRPIIRGGFLTAADTHGPLFGVTASNRSWLATTTAEFGHMPIISSGYTRLATPSAWTTGPAGANKSAAIVSFSAPPSVILSGADDSRLARFFDAAPSGRTIYYSFDAQPEPAILAHRYTAAEYRAAWLHVLAIARRASNKYLKPTLILQASDVTPGSGIGWKGLLPNTAKQYTIGWLAYPASTLSGINPTPVAPPKFMGRAIAAAKKAGLPFGFAGLGLATASGRPDWLYRVANYLMANGALFGVLTDTPARPTMELTDSASIAAWRQVVARSGTSNPLPVGSPTPSPTSSPAPQPTPSTSTQPPPPAPGSATPVCGQPILQSPYSYDGAAGSFASGKAGLPTYGTPGSDFPNATAGVVLPDETKNYENWMLSPKTVYYLEPGTHIGNFSALTGDAFVGGYANGTGTTLSGNYAGDPWAIDSNSSLGDQHDVTIEYLTIEKYSPPVDQVAINQDGNTGWTLQYNTITLNVPGGGAFAATDGTLKDNCMTLNGQYGFQSAASVATDALTTGPYNVMVDGNEISYNDTCDLSGLMNNAAVGWNNFNPVPAQYRNSQCGTVSGDGNQGGFKLWETDGVTIKDNYIHNNWGPGGWADTNNANTTWTGNTITNNEGEAIIEELSYNFSITSNYIADNDWIDGLNNPGFPQAAVYISESGSDSNFGGVPACPEASCAGQGAYSKQSVIRGNTLVDNGGNFFLWQNSNRYCSDGFDTPCTLVDGGQSSPFTVASCKANMGSASVDASTHIGNHTGSPSQDWWDGCIWETANISITNNVIDFNPANIPHCNNSDWPDCGAGGVFSQYGAPNNSPGWLVPTQITFFQHDVWANNTYNGPSTFYAWNQGNGDNPVNWADWTGNAGSGDDCGSAGEHQSGYCTGPFGQDAGSTYSAMPASP